MFKMRRVLQAERPGCERWRRVYMGNRAGKADDMLPSVYHCTLMCFRRKVDECVLNLGDCSLNEHLSLPACLARASFSLELPKGEVYIWQNKKESQAHPFLLRGMKELRSFRVTAQSEHLSEATFHGGTLCSSWYTQESLSHFQLCVCVCSNVCVRECRHERHRHNLHGNDVPVSQAPARIRGSVGGRGSVTQAKKRKNIRCWCTERIRLLKNIQLNLPFPLT